MPRIDSFGEFWPVYLRAHADPRCRALHYAATGAGLAGALTFALTGLAGWLAAGLVTAYALAWAGHYLVEMNSPLTFRYPLWSFAADQRMTWRWLSGHIGQDLRAAGVAPR